jgi:hypothetical protein
MSRHGLGFIAVVLLLAGCSAASDKNEAEPFAGGHVATSDPSNAPSEPTDDEVKEPTEPPAARDAGPGADSEVDAAGAADAETDAGKPADTADAATSGDATSDDDALGGLEPGYDPEKDDPWSLERQRVPQDHNFCLDSKVVAPGHYAGNVGSNSNDFTNPDKCGHWLPSNGRDAWVKVIVPAGRTLEVWANVKETGDYDSVLYVLNGSCGKVGTCVAGVNENLASREHVSFTNDTGAEATVHVVFDLLLEPEKLVEDIPFYLDIAVR